MPANLENSAVATGLEKVSFHSNLKQRQCQRMFKLLHNGTQFSSVQFIRSVMSDSPQPQGLQHSRPPCPSPTPGVYSNSCPLMPSNHLILCHPLLPSSIFPSIRVFSNESVLRIRWPKYWSISPSNEYSGLIFFRIDWFNLLAVQGTQRIVIGQKLYVALVSELRGWQLSGKSNS